ncbi:MAG: M28 family peptidase [Bacillota bacterium]
MAGLQGQLVHLEVRAQREPSRGCNVIARKGHGKRLIVTAHIDSKPGTPGTLDNAAGVVVLLLLGELLAGDECRVKVEIAALNGEDYYSAPGQVLYVQQDLRSFSDVLLAINIDGAGYHQGSTVYSFLRLPGEHPGNRLPGLSFLPGHGRGRALVPR